MPKDKNNFLQKKKTQKIQNLTGFSFSTLGQTVRQAGSKALAATVTNMNCYYVYTYVLAYQ